MDSFGLILVAFAAIIALVLIGIPVVASLLVGSVVLLVAGGQSPGLIALKIPAAFRNFTLFSIPLFILAAEIMMAGRLMQLIFAATNTVVGRIPGGLGISSILATMIFGGLSGSSAADAAAIGRIGTDGMSQYGYPRPWAAALIATAANLAVLVPPSIALIIYGALTGTSIGTLFFAGLLPAALLAMVLIAYTAWRAVRSGWGIPERIGLHSTLAAWGRVTPVLCLPAFILFGFYTGLFTPTEIAAVTVIASMLLGLAYRTLRTGKQLVDILTRAVLVSGNLFGIIAAGVVFSTVLVQYGVVQDLSRAIATLGLSGPGFLVCLSCALFVLGMFMDGVALNILSTPVVFPLLGGLGIDPVHYGIVLVFNVELALITPPVGLNLFVLATAAEVDIFDIYRAILPFIALLVLSLLVVILVPGISTIVPHIVGLARH